MASVNPDVKELKQIQQRISDIMRQYTAEQQERQRMLSYIEYASRNDVQLMSASASNSRERRRRGGGSDMQQEIDTLKQQMSEKEAAIGRLWNKLAELQERERELTAKSSPRGSSQRYY